MSYNLKLREAQWRFTRHIAHLINYAYSEDFMLSFGEAWRSPQQQEIYFKEGKSKTMQSKHLERLAVDFNIFTRGEESPLFNGKEGEALKKDIEKVKMLGEYWKTLHPSNQWGGFWGWDPWHWETDL